VKSQAAEDVDVTVYRTVKQRAFSDFFNQDETQITEPGEKLK
jgi:hypothetical protein